VPFRFVTRQKGFFDFVIEPIFSTRIKGVKSSARLILREIRNWPELAAKANYQVRLLVDLCCVNRRAVERFFRNVFKNSPQEWLDGLRQLKAEEMRRAGLRTKEIAYTLGYKDPAHFCHVFKRFHGICIYKWKSREPSDGIHLSAGSRVPAILRDVANRQSFVVVRSAGGDKNAGVKNFNHQLSQLHHQQWRKT